METTDNYSALEALNTSLSYFAKLYEQNKKTYEHIKWMNALYDLLTHPILVNDEETSFKTIILHIFDDADPNFRYVFDVNVNDEYPQAYRLLYLNSENVVKRIQYFTYSTIFHLLEEYIHSLRYKKRINKIMYKSEGDLLITNC